MITIITILVLIIILILWSSGIIPKMIAIMKSSSNELFSSSNYSLNGNGLTRTLILTISIIYLKVKRSIAISSGKPT